MRNRFLSLLLCLLLISCLLLPVFAEYTPLLPLVVDEADLLTEEEENALKAKAAEISERQKCDVIIYTTNDLAGLTEEEFADEKLDLYGYGNDKSGVLLLITYYGKGNADNYMQLATNGFAITAITDAGIDLIFDTIESDCTNGDFSSAAEKYLDTADDLLTRARNGDPYDVKDQRSHRKPNYILIWVIALLLGFLFSLIPLASMKKKIQNVSKKTNAASYEREGSMQLTTNRDVFLYANTTSRVIDTGNRGSGSSHSGGSTTHVTSSGSVHGGGGRHF